jgi:hypothetical protein
VAVVLVPEMVVKAKALATVLKMVIPMDKVENVVLVMAPV